jgi:Na+/melibiose symporter-like transporter
MMVVAPVAFALMSAAFILFYPLDRKMHGRLVGAIARRKVRQARASAIQ